MADNTVTIEQLPLAVSLDGTEQIPIAVFNGVGGYETKRTTTGAVTALGVDAEFVLAAANPILPNSRILAGAADQITITDGGSGENITVGLAATGVTAGTYGDGTHVSQIAVDAEGRITAASSVAITNEGTVTSVGLALPAEFTVSGSPVTSAGTLAAVWGAQAANKVLAGPPTGGATTPTFRSLVDADLPGGTTGSGAVVLAHGASIDLSAATALPIAGGGTQTPAGSLSIVTTAGPFTVTNEDWLVLNKGSASATTINLPAVASRGGRPLRVTDWGGNAGDITINADGGDSGGIMGLPTAVVASGGQGVGPAANITLSPSADLTGWLIASGPSLDLAYATNLPIGALVTYAIGATTDIASLRVPAAVNAISSDGYYAVGDGGGAVWKRISTPSPVQLWHIQSADGAWWQLSPNGQITPWQLGAKHDGATDDAAAIQGAVTYGELLGGVRVFVPAANYGIGSTILLGASGLGEFVGSGIYTTILVKIADVVGILLDVIAPIHPYIVTGIQVHGRGSANPNNNAGAGLENNPGIICHSPIQGEVYVTNCGSSAYSGYADPTTKCFAVGLIQAGNPSVTGLYRTDLRLFAFENYGDAVYVGNSSAFTGQSTNSMDIFVAQSFENTGWSVNNASGFGNRYVIQEHQSDVATGVVRFNDWDCTCTVIYLEPVGNIGVLFDTKSVRCNATFGYGVPTGNVWNSTNDNTITTGGGIVRTVGGDTNTQLLYGGWEKAGWNQPAGNALNFSILSVAGNQGNMGIVFGRPSNTSPHFVLAKSRSAAIGTYTAVQAADELGRLVFAGDDGTQFVDAAEWRVNAVATIATGIVPSTAGLYTMTEAGVLALGLRQDQALNIEANSHAAIATTATDGFLYVPTMAGAPTGTPTAKTGGIPIVFDTTNNKLWAYHSGWKGVVLS